MPSVPHRGIGRLSTSSSPSLTNVSSSATAASPSDDPASPSTPSTPSRTGFFSRLGRPLSFPLRGRNRNVADFHIRPEEPHRKYSAGESVRGAVVLVVVKPVRITHLVVSLHGYVRVLKDPTSIAKSQSSITLPQGGGSTRPRYHGNGFASLFQDEQVLSGEGRLEPGKYEFGFDLVFPGHDLPSSIDFERGTVSYMITATLTRPTSIAPTTSCDRKVMLVEKVDIGLLNPPRARTIFLEPISKRKRKKSMALEKSPAIVPEVNDLGSEADPADSSVNTEDTARGDAPVDQRSPIQSDMRSEMSGESGLSTSTGMSRAELALSQVGTLSATAKQQAVDDKTITATIELLRGGCLPGDTVSVRVTVQHIKRIKSMTGVIVTLFRQGKIDSSPPASMFTDTISNEDAKKLEKDEVYPRSKTGLGGLSLTSSSSTSMFRKDLDQNAAPLLIDPVTLMTSVTVSVKLPDDSFPTIKGVPGDMISFKYQVEVIVDLGGRLTNQFQTSQSSRFGPSNYSGTDGANNTYGPRRGANMADTSVLRREKGVISVSMETVVGTVDSSRGRKRSRASPSSRTFRMESDDDEFIRTDLGYMDELPYDPYPTNGQVSANSYFPPQSPQTNGARYLPAAQGPVPYAHSGGPPGPLHQPHHPHQSHQPPQISQASQPDYSPANGHTHEATPIYIPPPQVPNHSNLTEKERVRQAETRLLPSQPPAVAGPSTASENEDIYDAEETPRLPPANVYSHDDADEGPSAPTLDDISVATATPTAPVEDKQERERQRLMGEASAPPEVPEDMLRPNGGPSHQQEQEPDAGPSAPVLDDGDDDDFPGYGSGAGPSGHPSTHHSQHDEQLPAYQR